MLKWYSNLYISDGAKNKASKIIRKINKNKGQLGAHIITLATNQADQLEILSANILLQKAARNMCPMIVGIANSYEEAVALVVTITEEVYKETQTTNIRAFIENKEMAQANG